jgi:hypothetical protein
MVTPRRVDHARAHGRAVARWARGVVALPFLVALAPPGVQGVSAPVGSGFQPGAQVRPDTTELERRLGRSPEDPRILEALAEARLEQGRVAEAEALAARLVRRHPENVHGWALLATARYLQDDTRGALEAWSRGRPLRVRDVEVRVVSSRSAEPSHREADAARIAGLAVGEPLTLEGLVRGERQLRALPAVSRARLEYRALPGGEARVEGAVVLRADHPFERAEWLAHGMRLLGRRVHLASADPMGRMERWELNGSIEGTVGSGTVSLAHPSPGGAGVWRWDVSHGRGAYGPPDREAGGVRRLERSTFRWTHVQWLSASFQGRAQGRVDRTPDHGAFAAAGLGGTFLPLSERSSIEAGGTGWVRIAGSSAENGEPGPTRFGRLAIRASLHPAVPPLTGAPSGLAARIGMVAVSSKLPRDLLPRIGTSGRTDLLMRARSDLDSEGVLRPAFPGRAWVHGGIEYLRPVRAIGPLGIGVAAFAEGVRVVAAEPGPALPNARRGAIHLGSGLRARVPGVDGWLRVDWGVDPFDGSSSISAAWAQGPPG